MRAARVVAMRWHEAQASRVGSCVAGRIIPGVTEIWAAERSETARVVVVVVLEAEQVLLVREPQPVRDVWQQPQS